MFSAENNESSLKQALKLLQRPNTLKPQPADKAEFELRSLQFMGQLVAKAALERQESRGAHYREDFPAPLNYDQAS